MNRMMCSCQKHDEKKETSPFLSQLYKFCGLELKLSILPNITDVRIEMMTTTSNALVV